jgi:general secretion pathway protein A
LYLEYFGLTEAPFSITPDPTFIYLSHRHREALAHLLYGVGQGGSGGFVQLTGEVGTGKTTLCRCLLEQVPEDTRIALVLNPLLTPVEMLAAISEELGIDTVGVETSSKTLVDRLTRYLLDVYEVGGRVVVVIDEAQNLSPEALEQIRLLTNLETSKQKLLQIILLGQPELRELLQRRNLRQLAQRITARYHLTPLSPDDTRRYVLHRMQVAGARHNPFEESALKALYQRSRGVPRLINIIADRALVGAYAGERLQVNARLVHSAADEVQLGEPGVSRPGWPRMGALVAAVVVVAALIWGFYFRPTPDPAPAAAETEPAEIVPEPVVSTAPVEIASPEPEPPPVLDAAWLERQSLDAWRGLALEWGRPDDGGLIEAACRGTPGLGFACLRDQGSLARIKRLGLPVILQLTDQGGARLLLRGVNGAMVVVGNSTDSREVDRLEIESRWLGSFLVAWPQAANWPREVERGDTGPAVDTILDLAANADTPYQGEASFGEAFERWLVDFQLRNGLDPDGIVGPKTLLYLMSYSIEQPRLIDHQDSGA